jgi:hypothetical protein
MAGGIWRSSRTRWSRALGWGRALRRPGRPSCASRPGRGAGALLQHGGWQAIRPPLEARREGLPDPLKGRPLMQAILRGRVHQDLSRRAPQALWASLITSFAFLLGASEYLAGNDGAFDLDRALCWRDVEFRSGGGGAHPTGRRRADGSASPLAAEQERPVQGRRHQASLLGPRPRLLPSAGLVDLEGSSRGRVRQASVGGAASPASR